MSPTPLGSLLIPPTPTPIHTPKPHPALNRRGSQGLPHLPNACLCSFFPDQLPQAVNTCQESWPIHFALPTTLAVGFFLMGLGLGAVCVLKRTQVSMDPQVSPVSLEAYSSQRA